MPEWHRVLLFTGDFQIEGMISIPEVGYRRRMSDHFNKEDRFIALTKVKLTKIATGDVRETEFILVNKDAIILVAPAE
ncbi:MAG: hypothetical protein AB1696_14375 [Planctomycetota bacterium]